MISGARNRFARWQLSAFDVPFETIMELKMSLKTVVFGFSLLVVAAVPAFADSYKWGALSLDTEKAEKEPYYGVGGADTEKEAGDIAVDECSNQRQRHQQPL